MKNNPRINNFIQDILLVDQEKGDIFALLRKTILEIKPEAEEEIKYGGLVFIINTELVCGIFVAKNHISVEFSHGASILDPDNVLEGTGKYRRHIKVRNKKDIKNKKVAYFVKQSFELR